jgi:hypothetical protein
MHAGNVRPAFLAAGGHRNLRLRMPQQQLDQLHGRIAGSAKNSDLNHRSRSSVVRSRQQRQRPAQQVRNPAI